jgi:hypothetical protein
MDVDGLRMCFPVVLVASLIFVFNYAYASVLVYSPISTSISPVSPPIILIEGDYKLTFTGISRSGRGASVYTDFETYPISGWTSWGGSWSLASGGGYKGNALSGSDSNDGGLGGTVEYYYNSLLSYTSAWVSVKAKLVSGNSYYGIILMDSGKGKAYTAEILVPSSGTPTLNVRSYNVETRRGWNTLTSANLPSNPSGGWYVIVVNYVVTGSAVNIYVWLYDLSGGLVAYLSASSTSARRFPPAYIGVDVDWTTSVGGSRGTVYFDDFIISTSDPRSVVFNGLPGSGYNVAIIDSFGGLVNKTASTGSSLTLGVVSDVVVGTGSDGKVMVSFPNGFTGLNYTVPSSDAILGGDTYTLTYASITCSFGSNRTSASVSMSLSSSSLVLSGAVPIKVSNLDSKSYYLRLIMDSSSVIPSTLTVNVTLAISPSNMVSPIRVSSGSILNSATGWLTISAGSVVYVYVTGYFSSSGGSATMKLYLEYFTLPNGQGVNVYYPITVNLGS